MKSQNQRCIRSLILSGISLSLIACAATGDIDDTTNKQVSSAMPPAAKPELTTAGTEFHWLRNGKPYMSRVVEVVDGVVIGESSDGCKWKIVDLQFAPTVGWENCDGYTGSRKIRKSKGSPWPMQVGNKWSHSYSSHKSDGTAYSWNYKCKVAGTEQVAVGVGEFDTYKIVCRDKWNVKTQWFAPGLAGGIVVAIENNRDSGTTRSELSRLVTGK